MEYKLSLKFYLNEITFYEIMSKYRRNIIGLLFLRHRPSSRYRCYNYGNSTTGSKAI